MIEKKNFSNFAPGTIPADTEYVQCNFTQHVPDTTGPNPVGVEMFPGYSGPPMTFRNCNLLNCELPLNSVIEDCKTLIMEKGVDAHTQTITVDGAVVDSRTYKKSVLYGKINPQTLAYEYEPAPIDVPEDY